MANNNSIAALLDAAQRGGISYQHLAHILRVSRQTLYNWIERGEVSDERVDDVIRVTRRINTACDRRLLPVKSPEVIYKKLIELLELD